MRLPRNLSSQKVGAKLCSVTKIPAVPIGALGGGL